MAGKKRREPQPIDGERLRALAIRYVERYQTSRGRLQRYLQQKVRQHGWAGDEDIETATEALVAEMARLGAVDDEAFAASRARGMARRGLGARRVDMSLREYGIKAELRRRVLEGHDDWQSALDFARRKRLGPFGAVDAIGDAKVWRRQLAAFARAGHPQALAQRILEATSIAELSEDD